MRVLITGGNGFLGSNIARKLLLDGHSVMVLSNNSDNIQDIIHKIEYNKLLSEDLDKIISNFSPDVLVHAAWAGGNSYKQVNDASQFNDNISLGIRIIESLSKLNKKVKFVGIGSFSEYGVMNNQVREDHQENPINLYGLSKYAFKRCSKILCDQNSIDWVWIRPCYVYGKGDVKTRLIPRLIDRFSKNEDIELDECKSVLDYIHIEDFCNISCQLIYSEEIGVFNLCSGKEYQLKHIIETLHRLLKSESKILYNKELNRGTPSYICGDNKRILEITHNKPLLSLEEGLTKTIHGKNHFRN